MRISEIEKIKNKNYVVLLPKEDYDIKESTEYSFENVFYLDYELTILDADKLIKFVNENVNTLILFDYSDFYRKILPYIRKKVKVKWVYKSSFSYMTHGFTRAIFTNIMEFYDRNIVDEIVCLNYSVYETLRHSGYNVSYLMLDVNIKTKKKNKSNSIGIIGDDSNPNHNVYNELSALKLTSYDYVKLIKEMNATDHFVNFFDIKHEFCDSIDEVMSNNLVNLYCNFTNTNYELVLKSIDMNVPVILGNTDLFDKYPKLKELLVLESDDDINEIAYKINNVKSNIDVINNELKKFRLDYSKKSKDIISKLIK